MPSRPAPACSVDDVIVPTPRSAAAQRSPAETDALLALSRTLARDPAAAPQRLAETAMKLTGAHSAGISLEDEAAGEDIFRWIAAAGEFSRYLNGTMPRHASPCGTVLDRRSTLVMRDPVRHFPHISELHVPLHHVLLAPFGRRGKLVGTVWVISHTEDKSFGPDDVRAVEGLTTFATAVLDAQGSRPRASGNSRAGA